MADTARGVVVTTDGRAYVKEFGYPLHRSCESTLGGWIETVYPRGLVRPYMMLVNEEGLLHGLPKNLVGSYFYQTHIHGHPIADNIILMKLGYRNGERDIVGLEEDEAEKLMDMVLKLPFGIVRGEERA
ncbi:MAG: DUF3846 domain-containing protein [Oscillospiraceae bacterium]|nr:DUF3846 domain-containing protein [Oscillospiraceae bacterium]